MAGDQELRRQSHRLGVHWQAGINAAHIDTEGSTEKAFAARRCAEHQRFARATSKPAGAAETRPCGSMEYQDQRSMAHLLRVGWSRCPQCCDRRLSLGKEHGGP